ncbi:hypothetical protein MTO96_004363 [Rhipicephalus appendiculatus]
MAPGCRGRLRLPTTSWRRRRRLVQADAGRDRTWLGRRTPRARDVIDVACDAACSTGALYCRRGDLYTSQVAIHGRKESTVNDAGSGTQYTPHAHEGLCICVISNSVAQAAST